MNIARLASVGDMNTPHFMHICNQLADVFGEEIKYCRRWEYPWVWWNGLNHPDRASVLDIGSGHSPFPWWLSKQDFSVDIVDVNPGLIESWKINSLRYPNVEWQIVPDELLPFDDNQFDYVTSISVIEHQSDRLKAISEMIRVLKPGGTLAITCDVCEPYWRMSYPHASGRAYTLDEFEDEVWFNLAFGNTECPIWNFADIEEFLAWHKTTAPHHTYVAAGAILQKI